MMTCGSPAVPIINDIVYMNMFVRLSLTLVVYSRKPRSRRTWPARENRPERSSSPNARAGAADAPAGFEQPDAEGLLGQRGLGD